MVLHRYKQSLKRLFLSTTKSAALLLVSVEYDRRSRRTASHGLEARATKALAAYRAGCPVPFAKITMHVAHLSAHLRRKDFSAGAGMSRILVQPAATDGMS